MRLEIIDLGVIDYARSLETQKDAFLKVKGGSCERVFFCSHPPVITAGRSFRPENILARQEKLFSKGVAKYSADRGGDVTYHGPGQLTVYPVLNLTRLKKDIHFYLRFLEETIIDFLRAYKVNGKQIEGKTGVWVNDKKIASLGIAVRNWITFHGFSINIKEADMSNFNLIRPCGMDIKMTSLEGCCRKPVNMDKAKEKLAEILRRNIWSKYACLN